MEKGRIVGYDGQTLLIEVPFSNYEFLCKREIIECEVYLNDGRLISEKQREAICATSRDIGEWTGNMELERYIQMLMFCEQYDYELFSLSIHSPNCVCMSVASEFLSYLIHFCLLHNVPCSKRLLDRAEDIGKYLYACLLHKRCALCGGKADLHHVDAVGMGRDRTEIIHEGMEVLPLCRDHHAEFHTMGKESFFRKYHVFGIKLDKALCKVWGLKNK